MSRVLASGFAFIACLLWLSLSTTSDADACVSWDKVCTGIDHNGDHDDNGTMAMWTGTMSASLGDTMDTCWDYAVESQCNDNDPYVVGTIDITIPNYFLDYEEVITVVITEYEGPTAACNIFGCNCEVCETQCRNCGGRPASGRRRNRRALLGGNSCKDLSWFNKEYKKNPANLVKKLTKQLCVANSALDQNQTVSLSWLQALFERLDSNSDGELECKEYTHKAMYDPTKFDNPLPPPPCDLTGRGRKLWS